MYCKYQHLPQMYDVSWCIDIYIYVYVYIYIYIHIHVYRSTQPWQLLWKILVRCHGRPKIAENSPKVRQGDARKKQDSEGGCLVMSGGRRMIRNWTQNHFASWIMWKFSWSYIVLNMFCYVLSLKLAKFPLHSIAFKKDLLGGELQIPESKAVTSFHPGHFFSCGSLN